MLEERKTIVYTHIREHHFPTTLLGYAILQITSSHSNHKVTKDNYLLRFVMPHGSHMNVLFTTITKILALIT